MRRNIGRGLVVVAAVAAFGAMVGVPAAHATVACTTASPIINTSVFDSVVVPSGQSCTIQNSNVYGSVSVQPGGSLSILGSTIYGNVTATNPQSIRIDALGPCTVPGNPSSCARLTTITGNVSINGVTGVPAGFPANYVCNGTTIDGNLTGFGSGRAAPWAIGAPSVCSFGGNTIHGNVDLTNNLARVDFANNTVYVSVTASGNSGGGSIVSNRIFGNLVANNHPPCWTVSGNTVSGTTTVVC